MFGEGSGYCELYVAASLDLHVCMEKDEARQKMSWAVAYSLASWGWSCSKGALQLWFHLDIQEVELLCCPGPGRSSFIHFVTDKALPEV